MAEDRAMGVGGSEQWQRVALSKLLHGVLRYFFVFSSKEVIDKATDGDVQNSASKRLEQLACQRNGGELAKHGFQRQAAYRHAPSCARC